MQKQRTRVIVGSRGSALAQWQMRHVVEMLKCHWADLEVEDRVIKTEGDKDQVRPLAELGGLGVFTKAIEDALLSHEIDFAVHSLKDLPTDPAPGLALAAITERQDARDCLISRHGIGLMQLPPGARVGTSSARRTAQLLAVRPDLRIVPLRGNVDTRLRKAQTEEYDAIVLAAAGLIRLGRAGEITEYLALEQVLPDPGQGALAVEIRADDEEMAALLRPLDDAATHAAVTAERSFLRLLGGGCRMPMGAFGECNDRGLRLRGMIASMDGKRIIRAELATESVTGTELGIQLGARVLSAGGAEILGWYPLKDKRIVITRPRGQAGALAERVRALGGEPVEFPVIDFAPPLDSTELDRVLKDVRTFDWIIFTSANGVHAAVERLRKIEVDPGGLAAARIAAIGPATAHVLEEIGLPVSFVPTRFLGEQIAVELPIEPGQRALLLRADIASPVLAQGLQARGVVVTNVDAYRTVLPAALQDLPAAGRDLPEADAITFTSSSTVGNTLALLNEGPAQLNRFKIFCIGPVTAETARAAGLHVDAVATEHTADGLVTAMVAYYTSENATG